VTSDLTPGELGKLRLHWLTDGHVHAHLGEEDVVWTSLKGWSCSCGGDNCEHVAAVREVVGR